jgi:hypothetical protein
MTTPCNYAYQAVGPFSQTLYLGCSVVDFSMNMGWGGETSSCTVNLATDYSAHPSDPVFNTMDTSITSLHNNDGATQDTQSRAFMGTNDTRKNLQRTIVSKEYQKWQNSGYDDILTQNNTNLKNTGKKCWKTFDISANALDWLSYDPGFLGNKNHYLGDADFDIIGCPTFFRYADVWFGGMIKNWKYNNGKYTVEINGFSSLLKGCVLILQKYYGSISTVIGNTEDALENGQPLAVPYGDTDIPVDRTYNLYNPDSYKGSIYQGNIPNVFNIFGWLESQGFGNSGYVPDRGISAGLVYDAIVTLLNSINRQQNQFNPYGAIVAKTPLRRDTGLLIDPYQTIYAETTGPNGMPRPTSPAIAFTALGLIRCPIAVDELPRSLLRLDLSNVPRPPNNMYLNNDTMDLISFIDFCCENAGYEFVLDFEPDLVSSNYSGCIIVRTISRRIQALPNTIKDFILNFTAADKVVDYNFGEEYNDTKTRSILVGGPQQRLHQFTSHTYSRFRHAKIFEPMLNHFVDTASVMNEAYQRAGNSNNTYRMPDHNNQRPFDGATWKSDYSGSVTAQTNSDFWTYTEQSPYGQMNINRGSYFKIKTPILSTSSSIGLNNSYPLYKDIISPYFGKSNNGEVRRVYFDNKTREMQLVIDFRDIQSLFPTSYDINNGNWSSAGQSVQMYYPGQISFSPWNLLGTPTGGDVGYGKFVITESEIRHAMGSDDGIGDDPFRTWWNYHLVRASYNYPTALSRIIYDYWARAFFPPFAAAIFKTGLAYDKYANYAGFVNTMRYMGVIFPNRRWDDPSGQLIHNLTSQQYYEAHSDCQKLLRSIHGFVKSLGDQYYGKAYAVRMPSINWYVDNTGKTRFNYEVCDGAWEEAGNTIDDTVQVGSQIATSFADEQGKFGPMLAFDNMAEYFKPFTDLPVGYQKFNDLSNLQRSYMAIQANLDTAAGRNNWYFPLVHQLPENSFAMIPYASFQSPMPQGMSQIVFSPFPAGVTAHGFSPNSDQKYKLYVKSSIANENPDNIDNPHLLLVEGTPRVVLQTPSPVQIKQHLNANIEEIVCWALFGDESPAELDSVVSPLGGTMGSARASSGRSNQILLDLYMNLVNSSRLDLGTSSSIANRAAMPVFAAIPIKNNLMCYGPWVSHPGIIKNIVFPGLRENNLDIAMVNNLAGGVDVQIDDSLVPWEYGGMLALDAAALKKVAENNNFQQVLEYGSLTLAGIQLSNTRLGYRLFAGDYSPIVTSINVSIGANGITTRYEMRAFSRKLGFFNKEQADNIQKTSREFIKNYQRAYQNSAKLLNRVLMYNKPSTKLFTFS